MIKLVFATSNANKVREVQQMLGGILEIQSLKDIGCTEEIPETQPSIQGNAIQKANYVLQHYQIDCFAEDTGLEIDSLDGAPGVYSARYAGPQRDNEANIRKALNGLKDKTNRQAQFRTVIALSLNGEMLTFEGITRGEIIKEKRGDGGFGYDSVFCPEGHSKTFAEMSADEKNKISHRAKAISKLLEYLQKKVV